jgi:hypothetical protein
MAAVILSESGYNTGLSYDEACAEVEAAGYDSPRQLGYSADEVTWVGAEYARSELLDPGETWDSDAPYWYGRA